MEPGVLSEILKHKELWMRRSDVARNVGIPVSTLKYYTQEGLVSVAATTEGGMTLYDLIDVAHQLTVIENLKKEGRTISEIKSLLTPGRS